MKQKVIYSDILYMCLIFIILSQSTYALYDAPGKTHSPVIKVWTDGFFVDTIHGYLVSTEQGWYYTKSFAESTPVSSGSQWTKATFITGNTDSEAIKQILGWANTKASEGMALHADDGRVSIIKEGRNVLDVNTYNYDTAKINTVLQEIGNLPTQSVPTTPSAKSIQNPTTLYIPEQSITYNTIRLGDPVSSQSLFSPVYATYSGQTLLLGYKKQGETKLYESSNSNSRVIGTITLGSNNVINKVAVNGRNQRTQSTDGGGNTNTDTQTDDSGGTTAETTILDAESGVITLTSGSQRLDNVIQNTDTRKGYVVIGNQNTYHQGIGANTNTVVKVVRGSDDKFYIADEEGNPTNQRIFIATGDKFFQTQPSGTTPMVLSGNKLSSAPAAPPTTGGAGTPTAGAGATGGTAAAHHTYLMTEPNLYRVALELGIPLSQRNQWYKDVAELNSFTVSEDMNHIVTDVKVTKNDILLLPEGYTYKTNTRLTRTTTHTPDRTPTSIPTDIKDFDSFKVYLSAGRIKDEDIIPLLNKFNPYGINVEDWNNDEKLDMDDYDYGLNKKYFGINQDNALALLSEIPSENAVELYNKHTPNDDGGRNSAITSSTPNLAAQLTAAIQLQNLNQDNEILTSRIKTLLEEIGRLEQQIGLSALGNNDLQNRINSLNEQLSPLLTTKRDYENRIRELTNLKGTIDLTKLRTITTPDGQTLAVYDGKDFFALDNNEAQPIPANDPRLFNKIQGTNLNSNILFPDLFAFTEKGTDGKDTLRIADPSSKEGDAKPIIDYLKSQDLTVKFDGKTYGRITVSGRQVYFGEDGLFSPKENADDVYRLAFKYEKEVSGQYHETKDSDGNKVTYIISYNEKGEPILVLFDDDGNIKEKRDLNKKGLKVWKERIDQAEQERISRQLRIESRRRWAAQLNEIFYPGAGAMAIEKGIENLFHKDISFNKWGIDNIAGLEGSPWSTSAFAKDNYYVENLICSAANRPENIITPPTGIESRYGNPQGKWLDIKGKRYESNAEDLISFRNACPYNNNNPRWFPAKDAKGNLINKGYLYRIQYVIQHPFTKEQIEDMSLDKRKDAGLDDSGNLIFRIVLDTKPCSGESIKDEYPLKKIILEPTEKSQNMFQGALSFYNKGLIEKVCISFETYKPGRGWDENDGRKKCVDVKVEKIGVPPGFDTLPEGTTAAGTQGSLGTMNPFTTTGGTPASNADFTCLPELVGTPLC